MKPYSTARPGPAHRPPPSQRRVASQGHSDARVATLQGKGRARQEAAKWMDNKSQLYGRWLDPKVRRAFFDYAQSKHRTFYFTKGQLTKLGGSRMRTMFPGHVTAILVEFPEQALLPWKFNSTTRGWWHDLAKTYSRGDPVASVAVKLYIEHLKETFGAVADAGDLVTLPDVERFRLAHFETTFAQKQGFRLNSAAGRNKPIFEAQPSPAFWKDPKNRFDFLSRLKLDSGGKIEDLYSATIIDFTFHGAKGYLTDFSSAPLAVALTYPIHAWKAWKFAQSSTNFWTDVVRGFSVPLGGDSQPDPVAEAVLREWIGDFWVEGGPESDLDQVVALPRKSQALDLLRRLGGFKALLPRLFPSQRVVVQQQAQRKLGVDVEEMLPVEKPA